MIGKVVKIKWGEALNGESLYALGIVYSEARDYYVIGLNQIARNTLISANQHVRKLDKRLICGEASEEDINNFKKLLL